MTNAQKTSPKTHSSAKPSKSPTKEPHQKKKSKITPYQICLTFFLILWAIFATYASQFLVAYLFAILIDTNQLSEPGWTLAYYIVTYTITIILIVFVPPQVIKLYRERHLDSNRTKTLQTAAEDLAATPENMGVQKLPTFTDIGLAPIAYIAYLIAAAVLTRIMTAFPWFDANQAQDVGFNYFITDLDRLFAMISVVLVAPIAEEIMMRGWLYGKLRRKWNVVVAIILTSLTFALLHGQWNVGVTVFALSIMLCSLREITGTIWSGMLLHILSNGIAFYLLYVAI